MNTYCCLTTTHKRTLLALLMALITASGCGKADPAPFVLNQWPRQDVRFQIDRLKEQFAEAKDNQASKDAKDAIEQARIRLFELLPLAKHRANVLQAFFGTPDEPYILSDSGLDLGKLGRAAGPTRSDQQGSVTGLYRRHCVHCHGISGDGAGPTSVFLNPYPRDFRYGTFKFKSTPIGVKPTDDDLRRTLRNGIDDTAMPSFKALLSDADTDALIEYVKYLSLRGEVEGTLIGFIESDFPQLLNTPAEFRAQVVEELFAVTAKKWQNAPLRVVIPEDDRPQRSGAELRESIAAGRKLFYGKVALCSTCHGPSALGDGTVYYLNTPPGTADRFPKDGFNKIINWKLSPMTLRPRNLRLGHLRGGRRPLDIYRRIRGGIDGTPMPGLAPTTLPDEQVWNLVDYVLNLPYELSNPTTGDHQSENTRQVH